MKTCPHCNGPGELIWDILYCVECTECGARTEWYDREEDAVRAWERRDDMATGSITHNVVFDTPEATEALVKAMEQAELEAYRKTGLTVSELDEQAYKIQTYNDLLAELKQYHSLGSVEELAEADKTGRAATCRGCIEKAKEELRAYAVGTDGPNLIALDVALDTLDNLPITVGVVPREAYEQVAWERDVAIKQLWDDYGVRLGQKKADANGENI